MVLETFKEKHGVPPKELFIHGRTKLNDEEWEAFRQAAPPGTNIVAVIIKDPSGKSTGASWASNLTDAIFCAADLTEANLRGANLSNADFCGAKLEQTVFTDTKVFVRP